MPEIGYLQQCMVRKLYQISRFIIATVGPVLGYRRKHFSLTIVRGIRVRSLIFVHTCNVLSLSTCEHMMRIELASIRISKYSGVSVFLCCTLFVVPSKVIYHYHYLYFFFFEIISDVFLNMHL